MLTELVTGNVPVNAVESPGNSSHSHFSHQEELPVHAPRLSWDKPSSAAQNTSREAPGRSNASPSDESVTG
jgi:hypothetical protein